MKRIVLAFLFCFSFFNLHNFAQEMKNKTALSWKKIDALLEKGLPESALKGIELNLENALQANDFQESLKAYLYKMRALTDINPDDAEDLISSFDAFAAKFNKETEQALLHSIRADLYKSYYEDNQYIINTRTELQGDLPERLSEWTRNLFFDKIKNELLLSLQNADLLKKTDALAFKTVLKEGKDSRELYPTLYDFLLSRAIAVLNEFSSSNSVKNPLSDESYFSPLADFVTIKQDSLYLESKENLLIQFYQDWLAFRRSHDNKLAVLYVDMQRLQYIKKHSENIEADELYLKALENLKEELKNEEESVEVLAEIALHYKLKTADSPQELSENETLGYAICLEGIKRFPKYKRIALLENIRNDFEQKQLVISHKEFVKPGRSLVINTETRNIKDLEIKVFRVDAKPEDYLLFRLNSYRQPKEPFPKRKLVDKISFSPAGGEQIHLVKNEIAIKTREYGIYEFSIADKSSKKSNEQAFGVFTVSDFMLLTRRTASEKVSLHVLDRQTGNPIDAVSLETYEVDYSERKRKIKALEHKKTNKDGFLETKYSSNLAPFFLSKGEDKYFFNGSYYSLSKAYDRERGNRLALFTDRSIYRPGQTVYFKGILYSEDQQQVIKDANADIRLLDANRQEVSKISLKTNEFGSFKGEFVLPETGLNGEYQLESELGSVRFSVEEYKRPSFEIELPQLTEELFFDKPMNLSGVVKAYAGYSISDADLKYTIRRRPHVYCCWWHEPEKIVASGRAKADANGSFSFSFTPTKTKNKNHFFKEQVYSYSLEVEATDSKGETQVGKLSFSVGEKSLFILEDLTKKHERNSALIIPIRTENLNGQVVESVIHYTLYRLEDSEIYRENLKEPLDLPEKEKLLEGDFKTQEKDLKLATQKFESGYYKLLLTTKDAHDREVKTESVFVLYDLNETKPPVKTYVWLNKIKTDCLPGEEAEFGFGTSTEGSSVLYELVVGNKILKTEWVELSKEIKNFKIPFEETYGEGALVLFTFIKDEQIFKEKVAIKRKKEDKKLSPTLTVFRDKLRPGEQAEWTVSIPEALEKNKKAELMIAMYDASLDAIRSQSWSFGEQKDFLFWQPLWEASTIKSSSSGVYFYTKFKELRPFLFDQLNWFGFTPFYGNRYYEKVITGASSGFSTRSLSLKKSRSPVAQMAAKESVDVLELEAAEESLTIESEAKQQETVSLRTNFNETAFFYPQLQTDREGKISFKFTVPESLTRWNIKMLAHTSDLFFGQEEAKAITQKELMLQLNMPRFVRRSDQLNLLANVTNLSEKDLEAKVELRLIDPQTEKKIKLKDNKLKTVLLKPNETKTVEWKITEFAEHELVVVRVNAKAGSFSDGEQHYLPVLPDKVLLTESLPLTIRGKQTRNFRFESLLKDGKNRESKSLTVEFSGNPTWYAVQALPTLSAPKSENSISFFSAYYVNGLATYIANSNPKISKIFDRWKKEAGSRDALLSNLEKNKELKNVLLEETPWVMAAKNETEQKRQIALLFDLNQQKNQGELYLKKMLKLQTREGGFAWFEGMRANRFITQQILLEMARYNRMTKKEQSSHPGWIIKAVAYVDRQIEEDYEWLKKNVKNYNKEICIGNMQWFYLHLRSEYKNIPIPKSTQKAVEFYTDQAEKYWQEASLYGKAATALILSRNGNAKLSSRILKSLKENALKTDEFGMYWARNKGGFFWYERPVVVQTAILEAFAEVGTRKEDLEEMKIWLLKQKQTQAWDSPIASVDAIYALLNYGTDWLASEGAVEIKLGNKKLDSAAKEAGTAYLKKEFSEKEISPKMGDITVSKKDAGIAWGAVYWQSYENLDKVEQTKGALNVSKKLFVEKIEGTRRAMIPIEQTKLKKGDKVITRLVVSTDRNLDFVVLKDLRAACFEPTKQISATKWKEGTAYYQTSKDASTQFFFPYLPKGEYVFEYELWANNAGDFASGIATVQCQYAPEFLGHSVGERVRVQ